MNTEIIMQAFEDAFLMKEREELHKRLDNILKDIENELDRCQIKLEWIIDNAKTFEQICGVIRRIDEMANISQNIYENGIDCEYWRDVIEGVIDCAYK